MPKPKEWKLHIYYFSRTGILKEDARADDVAGFECFAGGILKEDARADDVAGVERFAGGMDLRTGRRDLEYRFASREDMEGAKRRLRAAGFFLLDPRELAE